MPTIEISIPYTPGLLKNKKSKFGHGHYYTSKEYSDAVSSLKDIVWGKSRGQKWKEEKIFVDIFLQKPQKRIDVANLVDSVCDAIKEGIGIDDCWFAPRTDWEYEKGIESYIIITINQN